MLKSKTSLLRESFPRFAFISYVSEMRRMLADCRSCLDIGCGPASPTRFLDFDFRVGIDGHEATLAQARVAGTHDEYYLLAAQNICKKFSPGQFDCCVALDLIEHLGPEEGHTLIRDMARIASKKILLFTPAGYLPQAGTDGDLQAHRSGWTAEELRSLGFTVVGMHGHKYLRGEEHRHRFRPKSVSGIVSQLSHYLYTRSHPEKAAALLCLMNVHQGRS
jgi:SAM-dependent methyltransferase